MPQGRESGVEVQYVGAFFLSSNTQYRVPGTNPSEWLKRRCCHGICLLFLVADVGLVFSYSYLLHGHTYRRTHTHNPLSYSLTLTLTHALSHARTHRKPGTLLLRETEMGIHALLRNCVGFLRAITPPTVIPSVCVCVCARASLVVSWRRSSKPVDDQTSLCVCVRVRACAFAFIVPNPCDCCSLRRSARTHACMLSHAIFTRALTQRDNCTHKHTYKQTRTRARIRPTVPIRGGPQPIPACARGQGHWQGASPAHLLQDVLQLHTAPQRCVGVRFYMCVCLFVCLSFFGLPVRALCVYVLPCVRVRVCALLTFAPHPLTDAPFGLQGDPTAS